MFTRLSRRAKIAAVSFIALLCLVGGPLFALAENGTISGTLTGAESSDTFGTSGSSGGKKPPEGTPPDPPQGAEPGAPGTVDGEASDGPGALPNVPHTPALTDKSKRHFCLTSGGGWSEEPDDVVDCGKDKLVVCQWQTTTSQWACTVAGQPVLAPASFCTAEPGRWPCAGQASTPPPTAGPAPTAVPVPSVAPSATGQPLPTAVPPTASTPATPLPSPSPTPSTSPSATASAEPAALPAVVEAIGAARAKQMGIWVESDLAPAYRGGPAIFKSAVARLVAAAKQPGVSGVKFAASLGFTGFRSSGQVTDFLKRAHAALTAALPQHRLAVEVVVPELGCGQNASCITTMRATYPLITATKLLQRKNGQIVGGYLAAVRLDRIYVASGLFASTYAKYKISFGGKPVTPSQAQWLGIHARGWGDLASIGSREYGLAHAGRTSNWSSATIKALIRDRVTHPIRQRGLQSVTIWGHKAADGSGALYRVLNEGLAANALWQALLKASHRATLSVVFVPTATEHSVAGDVDALSTGFGEIFIVT